MSRELGSATLTTLSDDVVYPYFAVELQFDGSQILRLWTGQGTLLTTGNIEWVGLGQLLSISPIEETSELSVKGVSIVLSGVPPEIISLALSEPYQGRVCNIYFGSTDAGELNEVFSGYMDQMNIEESAETATVELKVENKLIDLERARVARFTSGYQKSLYPDDLGLDFVESLQDKNVLWGRTS